MVAPNMTPNTFTGFDWFLVIVVTVSALLAFRRGMIRVLFSLAGWVVGLVVASWNYLRLAAWLHGVISNRRAAEAVAFLAVLMAVAIGFSIAAGMLRRAVKAIGLGFMDRLLGAGIGVLRGALLGVVAMMAMLAFNPGSTWIRRSVLAPYFLTGVHAVSFVVPQHLEEQVATGTKRVLEEAPAVLDRNGRER
jgi:membrane protein required for colicin V production